jgi:hypothetical protein
LSNPARGINNLAPVSADLNQGGWEVALAAAIGKNAIGVYIIRDTASGRIYKVGKATRSTTLVGRLESYAKDFMAHGVRDGGVRITAQVYKLPGDEKTAEMVLRDAIVNGDEWDLTPTSGAADGSADETREQGTAGWVVTHLT